MYYFEPGDEFRLLSEKGQEMARTTWHPPDAKLTFWNVEFTAYAHELEHVRTGRTIKLKSPIPLCRAMGLDVEFEATL